MFNLKSMTLIGTFIFAGVILAYEPVKYTFDDGVNRKEITVTKAPEKAVTLAQFMTESLLALDLGERMTGTALLNEEVLPEYREAYNKIPVLEMGEGHSISKEAFVATGVDFVSGWEQSISEEGTGSLEELEERGITPFISSALAPDSKIENVYEDFKLLGRIFDVSEKVEEVVEKMKREVEETTIKTDKIPDEEKVSVLIYDSGEGEAFVGGSGLPSDLVKLAGGKNIFEDLGQDYGTVSFESVVERNPQVIVVTEYYAGISGDEKIEFLKNHSGMRETDAVKNNRLYKIGLVELAPGIRNSKAIGKMYEMFYEEDK